MEQDPLEILEQVHECISKVCSVLEDKGYSASAIKVIGITNQRETTVVWDKQTGQPLHNAIVWQDTRTASTVQRLINDTPRQDKYHFQKKCGLPFSTYFSAVKLRWMLDNIPLVREEVAAGRCLCGTIDSWLIWNLTGGLDGGAHVTDVTNASRTMLMNLNTLKWDPAVCKFFAIPLSILPDIRSSAEVYGHLTSGPLKGIPISACLGDQHAALVGQNCFEAGQAKNTYGTGCFMLSNIGRKPVFSRHGLLTTVAYKLGPNAPCVYALEGAVAVAGSGVRWLRDNLSIISAAPEVEQLASKVDSSHGVFFVPAFSGLLAPHWRPDARGTIVGLTQYSTKAHIARATLDAVAFQTREVLEAMAKDCGCATTSLRVDGGMTANDLLMQIQADTLGVEVCRPSNVETTSWGAALAAGLHIGWSARSVDEHMAVFTPRMPVDERDARYRFWKKAVVRSFGWASSAPHGREAAAAQTAAQRREDERVDAPTLLLYLLSAGTLLWLASRQ